MDSKLVPATTCSRTPLIGKSALELVKALDQGCTYEELFPYVAGIAKELQAEQGFVPCDRIVKMFEAKGTEEYKELKGLFHTLHRKTLRALILGTIPHDVPETNSPGWEYLYPAQGAGAYLAGLSIEGRDGAFLSCKEIAMVLENLKIYRLGCDAYNLLTEDDEVDFSGSQLNESQKLHLTFALALDNTFLLPNKQWKEGEDFKQPIGTTGKGVAAIKLLEEQLQRRLRYKDSDPDVYQFSSPAYVGCSDNIASKMAQHDPKSSSMQGSSTIRKLLIACIGKMGLRVVGRSYPILLVWKPSQIRLAEILVTVLSQSLVSVGGLNVIQPGTSRTPKDESHEKYEENEILVLVEREWCNDNLIASRVFQKTKPLMAEIYERSKSYMSVEEMYEMAANNKRLKDELLKLIEEANQAIDQRARRIADQRRRLEESDVILEVGKLLLPKSSDPAGDEDEDTRLPSES